MKHSLKIFAVLLALCSPVVITSCSKQNEQNTIEQMADRVWEYSQTHPDGFTVYVPTMSVPVAGISVAYAETQNSHSRESLDYVVEHSIQHDGYVGGWLDSESGLYYFDSIRLFPEDQLDEAKAFGIENEQLAIYIISTGTEVRLDE